MTHFIQFADSSEGSIPSVVLPWLSMVLIAVCLWCMVVIVWRITREKEQINKYHLSLFVLCVSTIVFLGFGSEAVRTILAYQDSLRSILALDDSEAETEDLEAAIEQAPTKADATLAFEVFSRHQPEAALAWMKKTDNKLLDRRPDLKQELLGKEPRLQAAIELKQLDLSDFGGFRVEEPRRLHRLLTQARTDPELERQLAAGKFSIEGLDPDAVDTILGQMGAQRDGNHITFRR